MSSKKRFAQSARVEQDLIFYDGPQLVLLRSDRDHRMLAVGVEYENFDYAMFATEVHEKLLHEYFYGKVDLRFVFYASKFKAKYFLDFTKEVNGVFELRRALEAEVDNEKYYPQHGVFSRLHTNPLVDKTPPSENIRFYIDGTWESEDFSRFHGKIADIYSTTYIARKSSEGDDLTKLEQDFMRSSIKDKDWKGGGSYLGFYGAVKSETRSLHPLRVGGISYNSPGHIDLIGEADIISEVVRLISVYIKNFKEIDRLYKDIYRTLRKEKLLSAHWRTEFQSPAARNFVAGRSRSLALIIQMADYDRMMIDCQNNEALFAKVLLSFCRRLNDIAKFDAEGRLKLPKL